MEIAAIVFSLCAGVLGVFQIGLALGAPWGAAAYGGGNPGVLPARLRVVSAVAGFVLYPLAIVFVLDAADVADFGLADGTRTSLWMWILCGLFALGSLANFASRSKIERIWGPVALILAICAAIIAIGV